MSRTPKIVSLLLLSSIAVVACTQPPAPTPAEPAGPGPSEQAAQTFFEALHAADWARCADLLHPQALAEFDKAMRSRLIAAAEAGQEQQVVALLDGVDNVAQLEGLSPREFFVKFLDGWTRVQPQTLEMLRATSTEVLGEVPEGDDRRLVVYRMKGTVGGTFKVEDNGVLVVQREGEAWMPRLSDELKGLAQF